MKWTTTMERAAIIITIRSKESITLRLPFLCLSLSININSQRQTLSSKSVRMIRPPGEAFYKKCKTISIQGQHLVKWMTAILSKPLFLRHLVRISHHPCTIQVMGSLRLITCSHRKKWALNSI